MPAPDHILSRRARVRTVSATALTAMFLAGPLASAAHAVAEVPPLATASAFSVLAGSTVTNTGPTTIDRSVGVHPGTAVTGESTMTVGGTTHKGGAVALQAKDDLTAAYNQAAGQGPQIPTAVELGNRTLTGGVYTTTGPMGLTGVLTLDGENLDPEAIWVFQAGSTLITAPGASVVLINGANPCNVFWQVSSSATLDTSTSFVGTIMAEATITMNTGASIVGRTLARSGAVNLDSNVFTSPDCDYDEDVDDAVVDDVDDTDDTDDTDGTGGPGGTGGTNDNDNDNNGGTGNANDSDDQVQVLQAPVGAVDTGVAGPVVGSGGSDATVLGGWVLAAGFGGLALVALRRRQHM
ncbi:MAG: ice-binding family protein [Marmoricola sp.]